jgi:hypothetical protein
LISIRKENRRGEPIGGMIWFSLAMIGFCAVIVLLAGFALRHSSRSLTHRALTVTASVYACITIVSLWQLLR